MELLDAYCNRADKLERALNDYSAATSRANAEFAAVLHQVAEHTRVDEIAAQLRCSRASIYSLLKRYPNDQ